MDKETLKILEILDNINNNINNKDYIKKQIVILNNIAKKNKQFINNYFQQIEKENLL